MFYPYYIHKTVPFIRDKSVPKFDGLYCKKDCPCLKVKFSFFETIRVCKKYDRSIGLAKQSVIPRCGDCWREFGE